MSTQANQDSLTSISEVDELMKSILTICRGIYPYSVGGVEIHANRISTELANNYDITVVFESDKTECQISKWKMIRIGQKRSFLAYVFAVLFAAIRSRIRPDIIIVHTAYAPLVAGSLLSAILHTPFVVVVHGSDIRTIGRTSWLKYIQKMLMTKASRILCVSNDMQRILVNQYKIEEATTVVVPNGFDSWLLTRTPPRMTPEHPKLVFVGRLCWEKDPLTALKALKELKKNHPDVMLSIFGNGYLREKLQSYTSRENLQRNVQIMGQMPHNRVMTAVSESDLFILTSIQEGLPTAMIEAMALAKPVIATDISGVRELVRDGHNGLLVPTQDPSILATRARELLSDTKRAEALGRQARIDVSKQTWQHISCLYNKVIIEVTNRFRGRTEKKSKS